MSKDPAVGRIPATAREARYEARKQAWIKEQLENCPPLSESQKQLIRTAFATLRHQEADAA